METKDEIIIDLLLENKKLKKDLQEAKDSNMYWYKEYDKLKEKVETLETTVITFTEPKSKIEKPKTQLTTN